MSITIENTPIYNTIKKEYEESSAITFEEYKFTDHTVIKQEPDEYFEVIPEGKQNFENDDNVKCYTKIVSFELKCKTKIKNEKCEEYFNDFRNEFSEGNRTKRQKVKGLKNDLSEKLFESTVKRNPQFEKQNSRDTMLNIKQNLQMCPILHDHSYYCPTSKANNEESSQDEKELADNCTKKKRTRAKPADNSNPNSKLSIDSSGDSMDEDEDGIQYKEIDLDDQNSEQSNNLKYKNLKNSDKKATKPKNSTSKISSNSQKALPNISQILKCPTCPMIFHDTLRLNRHKRLHQAPQFQCSNCLKKFKRKSMLKNHFCDIKCPTCIDTCTCRMETSKDCIICLKINFRYFVDYKQHMLLQHNEIVICKVCEKHNFTFFKHKQLEHDVIKLFKCTECSSTLKTRDRLESHDCKKVSSNRLRQK